MAECPSCDRAFDTENAMKTHHVQAHDESIAGVPVECDWCGENLRVERARAEQDHQFCGDSCMGNWESENESGENAPHYKGKVTVECAACGSDIERYPSRVEDGKKYLCSDECKADYYSDKYSGENSWHWKGGGIHYYGPNWAEQRRKAILRDQARCQGCGIAESENVERYGRMITAHHIQPFRSYRRNDGGYNYKKANKLENLTTLCDSCHHRWEKFAPLVPV